MTFDNFLSVLADKEGAIALAHGEDTSSFESLYRARETLSLCDHTDVRERVALWVVAPCLAGFALWMKAHIDAVGGGKLVGVMREGRFLAQMMTQLFDMPAHEFWVNRNIALRAAFAAGDDEALLNWLYRTRLHPLTVGQATSILLDTSHDEEVKDVVIDFAHAQYFMSKWENDGTIRTMRERAKILKKQLLCHWDTVVSPADKNIFLLDFACAGNIQRSLRSILLDDGRDDPMDGLNFMTSRGVTWAQGKGCRISGFLADGGDPEWFTSAYVRTPELVEIFVAATCGALTGYDQYGAPCLDSVVLNRDDLTWLDAIKPRLIKAAGHYLSFMGPRLSPSLCRSIWGRFLLEPERPEAHAFGSWQLDAGINGNPGRQLAPKHCDHNQLGRRDCVAWPAASLLLSKMNR